MAETSREGSDEPMRGLTAPGPSKVGVDKAMRARDVSRAKVADRAKPQREGGDGSSGSSPVSS
jgi:hypothetical protein